MNQPNQYFTTSIRNSYGYQEQYRPNLPNKTYQPLNSSFQQENKLSSSIRVMQSRADGV